MKKPKVLIAIVNWNGKDDVLECLNSIKKINYPKNKFKTLVIDNASKDGSQAEISKTHPNILLLKNKKNKGYVKAINQGILYSLKKGFDYIWVFNNDVIVDKNTIEKLVEIGEKDKKIGIIAPIIYSYNKPTKIDNIGYSINFWTGKMNKLRYKKDIFKNPKEKTADVLTILGCSNLIKTSVFKKIGLFNPIYNVYFEETDFNMRAREKGFKVVVVKDAKIWHKNASTMDKFMFKRAYLLLRNLFIFEILNAKFYQLLFFIPYYFIIHVPNFIVKGILYKLKKR